MKILVDADSCPVKDVIAAVGQKRHIPVILIASINHRMTAAAGVQVITVDDSPQSVDIMLANLLVLGDIVVTQDWGLAALALGKKAKALSPRGLIFNDRNIDELLFVRHLAAKVRRGGGRTKGPLAFVSADKRNFQQALETMIELSMTEGS